MSRKNFLIIFAVFIFLIALGNVSANDIDDNLDNLTDTSDDIVLSSESSNDILADGEGSFSELQNQINTATSSSITLLKDYKYNSASDNIYGIKINKTLTINGNGKSIDGANVARIFNITGNGVVLNNIIIKNAGITNTYTHVNASEDNVSICMGNGAGILWSGSNGVLNNSQILNNKIVNTIVIDNTRDSLSEFFIGNGAGLYSTGNNMIVENTSINKNTIQYDIVFQNNKWYGASNSVVRFISNGAGAFISGSNSIIRKTRFSDNTLKGSYNSTDENGTDTNSEPVSLERINQFITGGALRLTGNSIIIDDCDFINNTADESAGAISLSGDKNKILNSRFINNTASSSGAILINNPQNNSVYKVSIKDSVFTDNKALSDGAGAIRMNYIYSEITGSNFTKNTANKYAGAIYWTNSYGSVDNCNFIENTAQTTAGAIYWSGSAGTVSNSNFTNNYAKLTSNDIYRSSDLVISNNVFTGFYAEINDSLKDFAFITLKATSDEEDIFVDILLGEEYFDTFYMNAKSMGNTLYSLSNLESGKTYTLTVKFTNGDNTYNNIPTTFKILSGDEYVLHVNTVGGGSGSSVGDCCSWDYALTNIPNGGTIILHEGTYNNIVNETITKPITVKGEGNVVINPDSTGRIFTIQANNVTLTNLNFINAYIKGENGGSIYWMGNNGRIIDSTFTNSHVRSGTGGAIYCDGLNMNITGSTFRDNSAITSNGGALVLNKGNAYLFNNIFVNNFAKGNAGAILWSGSNGELRNTTFTNNSAKSNAGSIYWSGTTGVIYNSIFIDSSAEGNAGAVYWSGTGGEITESNFTNNTAKLNSNDIYRGTSDLSTYDNVFTGDYIELVGGKYITDYITLKITSDIINVKANILIDNQVYKSITINSGAVGDVICDLTGLSSGQSIDVSFTGLNNIYKNNKPITFTIMDDFVFYVSSSDNGDGSIFNPCNLSYALENIPIGGKIVLLYGNIFKDINNYIINKNNITISSEGEVVFDAQGNARIFTINANNIKIENIAFKNVYGSDGAILINGNYNTISECIFVNNSISGNGAAIIITGTYNNISNSSFINNSAGSSAGAIILRGTDNYVDNCTFINNTANNGGAIYLFEMRNTISNSYFENNLALYDGGAIYKPRWGTKNQVNYCLIVNSVFVNNTAKRNGGAIWWQGHANGDIRYSSFVENFAEGSGGAIYWYIGGGNVNYCNFTNNKALIQSNDIYRGGSSLNCNYNNFIGDYIGLVDGKSYNGLINIKATSDQSVLTVNIVVDGVSHANITINSKYVGDTNYYLSDLSGSHNITLLFSETGTNTYKNLNVVSFKIEEYKIYVKPYAMGGGSLEDPCNFTYALETVYMGGIIFLLNYTFTDISDQVINKPGITISVSGNTIVDGQGQSRFFTINGGSVTLKDITFTNAKSNPASIYWTGSSGKIINCTFTNNSCGGSGGAIYFDFAFHSSVLNSTFKFNHGTSGGAIFFSSGHTSGNYMINNSIFINNTAIDAGAIFFSAISVQMYNSVFINNTAVRYGGVLVAHHDSNGINVYSCNFTNNHASNGGAIYGPLDWTTFGSLNDCIFDSNVASDSGGAIYSLAAINVYRCNFTNNSASVSKDIYATRNLNIVNCRFMNNYLEVDDEIIYGSGNVIVNPISDRDNVVVKVIVDGSEITSISFTARSRDKIVVSLPVLSVDKHNITLILTTSTSYGNVYSQYLQYFNVVNMVEVLYVSPIGNGAGDGSSIDDACRWEYALEHVHNGGKIILLDGTYKTIVNQLISKSIIIQGSGKSIIDANSRGSVFNVMAHNVVVDNVIFVNGVSSGNGSAIVWGGNNGLVNNSVFKDNVAGGNGAVYWGGNNGTIVNSNFTNNTGNTVNDVCLKSGVALNISNNIFTGNYLIVPDLVIVGGSVVVKPVLCTGDMVVDVLVDGVVKGSVTIVKNSNGGVSFVLPVLENGNRNISLSFNSPDSNRYIQSGLVSFNYVIVDKLFVSAYRRGSGFSVDDPCSMSYALSIVPVGGTIVLLNETFNNILNMAVSIANITICGSGNTILDNRGVNRFFVISESNVTIANLTFKNGKSDSGGAISSSRQNYINIVNCTFINNTATYAGGAIYFNFVYYSNVINCTFIGNNATNIGGAIYAKEYYITVNNCIFNNNTATNGGAIYVDWSNSGKAIFNCYNSIFMNNKGSTGGAVCMGFWGCSFDNCTFINNSATNGGVFYDAANGQYSCTNSIFINNTASNNGGAINGNTDWSSYNLYSNIFINNVAGNLGGAIYNNHKGGSIQYNAFVNVKSVNENGFYNNRGINIDYNWWGSNDGPNSDFISGVSVPTLYLIATFNPVYYMDGDVNMINVTTVFKTYNKNTGAIGDVPVNRKVNYPVYYTINGVNITKSTMDVLSLELDKKIIKSVLDSEELFYDTGSFYALQDRINQQVNNGVIVLNYDYTFNSTYDSDLIEGINVNKPVTIDGDGFTIDAKDSARIFNIAANNVILDNLTLINAVGNMGGAIYWNADNGKVNRSKFYNNTAVNGSAIFTEKALEVYNSEFLDNVANIYLIASVPDGSTIANIHFANGDNYINAIYSKAEISGSNVSYWNSTAKVTIDSGFKTDNIGQKLNMEVLKKIYQSSVKNTTGTTDSNGNVTISDLAANEYYSVVVNHVRGPSKFSSGVADLASNITITNLELIVPGDVKVGDDFTVIAFVNSSASGNVSLTINNTNFTGVVVDGRALISVRGLPTVGNYSIVAIYHSDENSIFYGQRNVSSVTVKVKSAPYISVISDSTVVNNTVVVIKAVTNFISPTNALQLVVRLQHFSCNTLSVGLF